MPHIGNFPERGHPEPLSVPPPEFLPEKDTFDYVCNEGQLRNFSSLTSQAFYAPVFLPDKATVTKLTLYGYRTTAGSMLALSLKRVNRTGASYSMTSVSADWTDGAGSKFITQITDPVIDNENYVYTLTLTIDPDAAVGDCYFYAAEIEWR